MFCKNSELKVYLQCFISLLLYQSGGHTLHELLYPLTLPEIKENFLFINEFNKINMQSLFQTANEQAFDKALNDTILYPSHFKMRTRVNAGFESYQ